MTTLLEDNPEGVSLSDLAAALRVSSRSVRRYLRELGKSTKLEGVETRHGPALAWRIKPTERGRAVMLRRTQAYGLLAVRRAFEVMRGSALYDELDVVTRALLQLAHRPTHLGSSDIASDTRLESRFVHVPEVQRSYAQRGAELDDLFRAVADLRVLSFLYSTAGGQTRVILHPYAMILYRGAVHAIGLDVTAGKVDTFLLDKIRDTRASDEARFALPPDFDTQDFVHGAFGVAPPSARARVTIEFDARVAESVRAERVHPTQRIAAALDGRVRLTMTVPLSEGLIAWVLSFGPAARVVEPRELTSVLAERLRDALARYS